MMVIGRPIGRSLLGDVAGLGFGGLCIDAGNRVKAVLYELLDSILGPLSATSGEYPVVRINLEPSARSGRCLPKISQGLGVSSSA